jgi:uncharacterized metal-binding protein
VDFINMFPVLAVEACDLDCAARLIEKKGKQAARKLRISEVAGELGLDIDALPEQHIDCEHPSVQALAKHIAEQVDDLLSAA